MHEKYEIAWHILNTQIWLLNRKKQQEVIDSDNVRLSRSRYHKPLHLPVSKIWRDFKQIEGKESK
jgi:hypothetical protein